MGKEEEPKAITSEKLEAVLVSWERETEQTPSDSLENVLACAYMHANRSKALIGFVRSLAAHGETELQEILGGAMLQIECRIDKDTSKFVQEMRAVAAEFREAEEKEPLAKAGPDAEHPA